MSDNRIDSRAVSQGLLIVFLVMMSIFGYLAFRADANTRGVQDVLRQQQAEKYKGCLAGVAIISQLNEANYRQIALEESVEYTSDVGRDLQTKKIAAYKSALILPVPNCETYKNP